MLGHPAEVGGYADLELGLPFAHAPGRVERCLDEGLRHLPVGLQEALLLVREVLVEGAARSSRDQEKCELKPLTRSEYYPDTLTAEEWAQLQKAFPTGVCDFSKPGVKQQDTIPWQTYQDEQHGGAVVYGGRGLGPAPAESGEGWASESFDEWLG